MSEQHVPQRIGDAERDRAVECLQEHMAQGRLTQDEFDERMTAALKAKVSADLDPLFTDLPEPRPAPARPTATASVPNAVALPPTAGVVQQRRGYELALGSIAALAWPLTIVLMIATHAWGEIWWLWIIPVMFTGAFGRYRRDRRR